MGYAWQVVAWPPHGSLQHGELTTSQESLSATWNLLPFLPRGSQGGSLPLLRTQTSPSETWRQFPCLPLVFSIPRSLFLQLFLMKFEWNRNWVSPHLASGVRLMTPPSLISAHLEGFLIEEASRDASAWKTHVLSQVCSRPVFWEIIQHTGQIGSEVKTRKILHFYPFLPSVLPPLSLVTLNSPSCFWRCSQALCYCFLT